MVIYGHPPFAKYVKRDETLALANRMQRTGNSVQVGAGIDPAESAALLFVRKAPELEGDNLDQMLTSSEKRADSLGKTRAVSLAVGGLGIVASFAGLFVAVDGVIHPGVKSVIGLAAFGVSQWVGRSAVNYSNKLEAKIEEEKRLQMAIPLLVDYIGKERVRDHQEALDAIKKLNAVERKNTEFEFKDEAVNIGGVWVPLEES
ncbi:MAG: hypothetical protein KC910_34395 [Candidatus Eremiobacteraeota bacterium]|nr:hypothetical protein [Candidatus Eremiobacteraeota bacterium]